MDLHHRVRSVGQQRDRADGRRPRLDRPALFLLAAADVYPDLLRTDDRRDGDEKPFLSGDLHPQPLFRMDWIGLAGSACMGGECAQQGSPTRLPDYTLRRRSRRAAHSLQTTGLTRVRVSPGLCTSGGSPQSRAKSTPLSVTCNSGIA